MGHSGRGPEAVFDSPYSDSYFIASKSVFNYGLASNLRVAHPFKIGTIMNDSRII